MSKENNLEIKDDENPKKNIKNYRLLKILFFGLIRLTIKSRVKMQFLQDHLIIQKQFLNN